MIALRKATMRDLKRIQDLNRELFVKEQAEYDSTFNCDWPHSPKGKKYFSSRIRSGFVTVAIDDDVIVGYLAGNIIKDVSYRFVQGRAELENMFVLPSHRNKGVGSKLVKSFLRWCKEKKAEGILVIASHANERAVSFYRKHGFKYQNIQLEINPQNKHAR